MIVPQITKASTVRSVGDLSCTTWPSLFWISDNACKNGAPISASKVSHATGDGAFAKNDIPHNTPYAVYSGQIFNDGVERKELINMQYSKIKQFIQFELYSIHHLNSFNTLNISYI